MKQRSNSYFQTFYQKNKSETEQLLSQLENYSTNKQTSSENKTP